MKLTNITTGRLILPDGTVILPGESADITKEVYENIGVQGWIAEGLAADGKVKAEPDPKSEPKK